MPTTKIFFVNMSDNAYANNILTHISASLNAGFWVTEEVRFSDLKNDYLLLDQRVEAFREIPHEYAYINAMTCEDFQWLAINHHLAFDWCGVYYFQNMKDMDKAVANQAITADLIALSIDGPKTWVFSTKLFDLEDFFKSRNIQYELIDNNFSLYAGRRYDLS